MSTNLRSLTDKTAIGVSLLCLAHCLAVPLAVVLVPSLAALSLDNEYFHVWMVFAVIPTSAYALTMGCRRHKRYQLLALGFTGLVFLVLALLVGESYGEAAERILTAVGAFIIAYAHFRNYRLCRDSESHSRPNPAGDVSQ